MEVRRRDRNARLRALTSAAYTAAAGHLELSPEDDVVPARRRWAPSARSVVVAGAAVLACALAVVIGAWLSGPGDPVPLPPPAGTGPPAGDMEAGVVGPGHAEEPSGAGERATVGGAPESPGAGEAAAPTGPADPAVVVVHVAGAVVDPGVVELPAGARVGEAVDAAGGATGEADLGAVNLARLIVDGEQVYVPLEGERPTGADAGGGAGAAGAGATGTDAAGGSAPPGAPVNLNTATAAELDSLPGVGPAIAQRILEWRDLNGSFTSVDDLDEVSGIGPATLERLRPLVTV